MTPVVHHKEFLTMYATAEMTKNYLRRCTASIFYTYSVVKNRHIGIYFPHGKAIMKIGYDLQYTSLCKSQ